MANGEITEAEFYGWLKVPDAVAVLAVQWELDVIVGALLKRLHYGQMQARAETMITSGSGLPHTRRFEIVPATFWEGEEAPGYYSNFWQTGDFERKIRTHIPPTYACFGVRFAPQQIAHLVIAPDGGDKTSQPDSIEPTAGAERKTRHGLPALRDELLADWHALFVKAYPAGSKGLAEKSSAGMFPNHSVDREKVRELFPHAKRGRPQKTEDN